MSFCSWGGILSPGGGLCPGGLCPRVGSLSEGGVSVRGWGLCLRVGSLSEASLFRGGVSVQGWGLCPGVGSLSRGGVSVRGSLSKGVFVRESPLYGKERVSTGMHSC